MPDKNIEAWLVVDWKKESVKARKTEPHLSELGTNELKAKVDVDVTVPDVSVPTLSLEIDVPEPRVYAATIEALDEDDLPEWADEAIEQVDQRQVEFEQAGNAPEWSSAVDSATIAVLRQAPGRPDVERVREFVEGTAADMFDTNGTTDTP